LCPCCEDSARGAAGVVQPIAMLSGPFRDWRGPLGRSKAFGSNGVDATSHGAKCCSDLMPKMWWNQ
jgi:hypothetical protein